MNTENPEEKTKSLNRTEFISLTIDLILQDTYETIGFYQDVIKENKIKNNKEKIDEKIKEFEEDLEYFSEIFKLVYVFENHIAHLHNR